LTGREDPATPEDRSDTVVQQSDNQQGPAQLAEELDSARELFAAADAKGLLRLLETGQDQTRIAVANYLARMGEESALPALQKLADQWQGPVEDNPFRKSIEQIRGASSGQNEAEVEDLVQEVPPIVLPTTAADNHLILTVHVSEKATGAPIPHATIGILASGKGERHTSDDHGVFVVDLGESVPALVMISVSEEGYVGQIVSLRGLSRQKLPQIIEFSLDRGTVIGGMVQDSAGRPIKGAIVESHISEPQVLDRPHVNVSIEETTDDQGWWRCTCMPAQIDRLWFSVRHPEFADGGFEMPTALKLDDLRAERAVMVLEEGIVVAGRVADADGNPIAGAELLVGQSYNGRDLTKTDVAGHFEFPHLRVTSQSFLLTVQAEGFAPQRQELPSQKDLAPVQFVLQPATLLIGRVVDSADHAVEGASVSAQRWNTYHTVRWSSRTDARGTFTWNYAPTDAIEIRIGKEDYRETFQQVVADGEEHVFILARPMTIRGSVIDSQTGEPVSQFKLTPGLEGAGGGLAKWQPSDDWSRWFTDGRYSYTFSTDAQAYGVRIEAEGYAPVESRFVDANEVGATIDVALIRAEEPWGYVFDAEACPVAGATVFWASCASIQNGEVSNADSLTHTMTDSDGHFVFPADNRKDPLFVVCDQGMGIVSWEEFTKTGIITLTSWARVQGDLRIGHQPGVGKKLRLTCYNRLIPSGFPTRGETTTDAKGRFAFERVYPGDFTLHNETYQVLPGQTLELRLGGTGRTIKGQLILPDLADVPIRTTLVVRPRVSISFDQFPKPARYEQMNLDEFRAWLDHWDRSEESRTYRDWMMRTYPQMARKDLLVEMDGRSTFHADNVEPGIYTLVGVIRHSAVHGSSRGNGILGRLGFEFEVPPLTQESELDIPLDLGALTVLPGELKPGDPAPDFDVPTFGPNRLRLRDYRGKVLLVGFYSGDGISGSLPVLEDLKDTYQRFHGDPRFAQIGLLITQYLPLAKKVVAEGGWDWPHGLVTNDGKESTEYGVSSMATPSVLIGPQGNVLAVGPSGEALTQAIEDALQAAR
ncbi:MAG: carboxypeptidase regulatory-like domain-containing protein, partial [Solirubrobacterales bacterium]